MLFRPERYEINHRTIKLLIGLIAISLANVTAFFSSTPIASISASYYDEDWARDFLVGSLFAISAFLFAYNGRSSREMLLSKIAAVSALGVALFPCKCGDHPQLIPGVHVISAAIMFVVLALFCYTFYRRAKAKGHRQANWRAGIYVVCGLAIVASIALLALDHFLGGVISAKVVRLTFYCERAALIAFGISWLTASHVLPVITDPSERVSLLPNQTPRPAGDGPGTPVQMAGTR
jgi:hypothetical protein